MIPPKRKREKNKKYRNDPSIHPSLPFERDASSSKLLIAIESFVPRLEHAFSASGASIILNIR